MRGAEQRVVDDKDEVKALPPPSEANTDEYYKESGVKAEGKEAARSLTHLK